MGAGWVGESDLAERKAFLDLLDLRLVDQGRLGEQTLPLGALLLENVSATGLGTLNLQAGTCDFEAFGDALFRLPTGNGSWHRGGDGSQRRAADNRNFKLETRNSKKVPRTSRKAPKDLGHPDSAKMADL